MKKNRIPWPEIWLKKTKLVRTRKIGQRVYYSMADDHIKTPDLFQQGFYYLHVALFDCDDFVSGVAPV